MSKPLFRIGEATVFMDVYGWRVRCNGRERMARTLKRILLDAVELLDVCVDSGWFLRRVKAIASNLGAWSR